MMCFVLLTPTTNTAGEMNDLSSELSSAMGTWGSVMLLILGIVCVFAGGVGIIKNMFIDRQSNWVFPISLLAIGGPFALIGSRHAISGVSVEEDTSAVTNTAYSTHGDSLVSGSFFASNSGEIILYVVLGVVFAATFAAICYIIYKRKIKAMRG